jgi:predicted amino acid racemase
VIIDLERIAHNIYTIVKFYKKKGIKITPVTKGVCGSIEIAKQFSGFDIHSIGDSHLENILKMKKAGVDKKFMLLRSAMLSEAEEIAANVDISLNSEMTVIKSLNKFAKKYGKIQDILLMIELGDLREGILPSQVDEYVEEISDLSNIRLAGIGTNLACLSGIKPTGRNMDKLSSIAEYIQNKYKIQLSIISGGNSANYQWTQEISRAGMINHLRIGESILLGTDPISKRKIPGLRDNAFQLQVEVIEIKRKPSTPTGIITFNAFGETPSFEDEGEINRAILAIGSQDLDIKGCSPIDKTLKIIGSTSDHLIINSRNKKLKVGDIVEFQLTYSALLHLMVSPYIDKKYIQ